MPQNNEYNQDITTYTDELMSRYNDRNADNVFDRDELADLNQRIADVSRSGPDFSIGQGE